MVTIGRDRGAQMKAVSAEAHDVLISRAARRTKQVQVVNGFKDVRLALPIFTDQHEAVGGSFELDVGEIAEIVNGEPLEPRRGRIHAPVKRAARFSRKARVPSRLSSVAASSPKAVASSVVASSSVAS